MDKLNITSCLARNTYNPGRAVSAYLSHRLRVETEFIVDIDWQERARLLDTGQIHVGWICGLLYVWKVDQQDCQVELLAAPVMRNRRYEDQPIYFTDLVVRRDSPYHAFADLEGSCWVYNEPDSYSGYTIVCHRLVELNKTLRYFDKVKESGAHLYSLEMVVNGRADVTAIDSTILDYEFARQPALVQELRVIETLGPSPIPPWVISLRLPQEIRSRVRHVLLEMHRDPAGRKALADGQLSKFVAASDDGYRMIREVAQGVQPA